MRRFAGSPLAARDSWIMSHRGLVNTNQRLSLSMRDVAALAARDSWISMRDAAVTRSEAVAKHAAAGSLR